MNKKSQVEQQKVGRTWERRLSAPDEEYLLRKPQQFGKELLRILRISWEYNRGILAFRRVTNCISVFGSARFMEVHSYYQLGREVEQQLVIGMVFHKPC